MLRQNKSMFKQRPFLSIILDAVEIEANDFE